MINLLIGIGCKGIYGKKRDELYEYIKNYDKDIKYTYGFSYRNPTTKDKILTKEEAINIIKETRMLDVYEYDDHILINEFSANDLF